MDFPILVSKALQLTLRSKKSSFYAAILFINICVSQALLAQVASPNLHCVNLNATGDAVDLAWTVGSGSSSCGATFQGYQIYRGENPSGPFSPIYTETNAAILNYTDSSITPGTTYYYYIIQQCGSANSGPSDIVDTYLPVAPELSLVSVTANNNVSINWTESDSPEVYGYIIYRREDVGFEPIDTILDASAVNYTDLTADPSSGPQAYQIAAFDSCSVQMQNGNVIDVEPGPTNTTIHETIFLSGNVGDCTSAPEATFTWTPYLGFNVEEYNIVETTPTSLTPIATLNGAATSYTYQFPAGATEICLTISAKNAQTGQFVNSNKVCLSLGIPIGPAYIYLTGLSVAPDNTNVNLQWNMDMTNTINTLQVLRNAVDSLYYEDIETFPQSTTFTTNMTYNDSDANVNNSNYWYKIRHIDECNRYIESNGGSTIRLRGLEQTNQTYALSWNAFYLPYATINSYTLYRDICDGNGMQAVTTINNMGEQNFTYNDAAPNNSTSDCKEICYAVQANYTLTLPNGYTEDNQSQSNTLCISPLSRVYFPTAFTPTKAENQIFLPIMNNPSETAYSFTIFNRWGELLFTSNSPNEGWNGLLENGEAAPQGVYSYYFTMHTQSEVVIEKKGTVLLIR